ncbi:MAG: serine hydrolase, partial [Acidobacteria bacterium]
MVAGVAATLALVSWTISAQQRAASVPQAQAARAQAASYFPERLDWQRKQPEAVGMAPALVADAVRAAVGSEMTTNRDLATELATSFGRNEPFDTVIGPTRPRGPASGVIVRNGYLVTEWGEPGRADMTNSVTKTFLTTVIGLAWQRGLIRDLSDYVRDYMPPHVDLFEAEHNQKIRWEHLLRQTSDGQGTLWGKPDWADRPE